MKLKIKKTPFKFSLGDQGEALAWQYLRKKGYVILETNYRCKLGELDGVLQKNGEIIFVEIKCRRTHRFGRPEEAVGSRKQQKIIALAQYYLKNKRMRPTKISFAVVAITWHNPQTSDIQFIQKAFTLKDDFCGI